MWEPQFANLARRVAALRVAMPFRHASPRLERWPASAGLASAGRFSPRDPLPP